MVNISTKATIKATVNDVSGPKINPLIAMIISFGSYFKKSTRGTRKVAVAAYARAQSMPIVMSFFVLLFIETPPKKLTPKSNKMPLGVVI